MAETKSKRRQDRPEGVCWVCSCTEDDACPGGCAWVNPEQTLCSACAITIAVAVSTAIMGLLIERADRRLPRAGHVHQAQPAIRTKRRTR